MSDITHTIIIKKRVGFTVDELIDALQEMGADAFVNLANCEDGRTAGVCAVVKRNEDGTVTLSPVSETNQKEVHDESEIRENQKDTTQRKIGQKNRQENRIHSLFQVTE